MAAALAATYPDLFAGAAFVSEMPVGAVRDAMSALRAMKSGANLEKSGMISLANLPLGPSRSGILRRTKLLEKPA